jgi:hypothetical protein
MPFINTIHQDQLLSNVSVKYRNEMYIWDQVFAPVMVKKDSDRYRVYTRNFRLPETKRANKGESREHYFEVTSNSYLLEKHGLKDYVSDDDARNYDLFSLESDTTEELTDTIQRRIERSVADLFTTTSWSLNVSLAAANAFNANTTVSDPVPVFDTGSTTIVNNSGMRPNYGILPREGMIAVKNHVSVLDRVKYTSSEMDEAKIAALLGLQKMLVPHSVIDSAALGVADSIAAIWGDSAFLGYNPGSPGPLKPASGYTFMLEQPRVKKWREESRESNAIEVNILFQPKVVASLTGYLIKDIV